MRCFVMFVTAVCILFLFKLKWPKNKSFYDLVFFSCYFLLKYQPLTLDLLFVYDDCDDDDDDDDGDDDDDDDDDGDNDDDG